MATGVDLIFLLFRSNVRFLWVDLSRFWEGFEIWESLGWFF